MRQEWSERFALRSNLSPHDFNMPMMGQTMLTDALKKKETRRPCMTEPGLGPERAWLGRVEWSEERTTRRAPLKCYKICSYSRPLMAGDGKFHAQGRGW